MGPPRRLRQFLTCLLASVICTHAFAEDPAPVEPAVPEREIALKDAKKQQVRETMIGFRDTLVFYTLAAQNAVLVLQINHADSPFKVTGTLHLFDPETTAENLAKWVNNQHSDGLFIDPPTPTHSLSLPDGTCTVTNRKIVGEQKQPDGKKVFTDFQVEISIRKHHVEGKYRLAAFKDEANVYLQTKGS